MDFCSNCGHKLTKEQEFCPECGQSASANQEVASAHQPRYEEQQRSNPRKPMSKKTKVLSASILAAAVVLGGGYYAVNKMVMSPRAVSEGFVNAVKEKDIDKVKSYVNEGQIELSANDEQTKSFVEYLHHNPKVLSSINDGLLKETASYEAKATLSDDSDDMPSPYAHLQKDGKKWGIFDHYTVRVNPAYAAVTSNEEGATVYVDNQKVGKVNSDEEEKNVGPFLPGTHKIKAVIKNEYGTVSSEQSIDTSEEEAARVDFDWSDYEVYVYSDYDNATLYVNGKSTDTEIGDLDYLGPLPMDGSVKVYAKRNFASGTKKTKVVEIRKNTSEVNLMFESENEVTIDDSDEIENHEETEAENDTSAGEEADIKDAITSHYNLITSDDFSSAYNYFASSRKSSVDLADWSKGLQANSRDDVTEIQVTEVDGNEATAYIEMTSYDDNEDGSTLVQDWEGSWDLVKENGKWRLSEAHLDKVDSRTE